MLVTSSGEANDRPPASGDAPDETANEEAAAAAEPRTSEGDDAQQGSRTVPTDDRSAATRPQSRGGHEASRVPSSYRTSAPRGLTSDNEETLRLPTSPQDPLLRTGGNASGETDTQLRSQARRAPPTTQPDEKHHHAEDPKVVRLEGTHRPHSAAADAPTARHIISDDRGGLDNAERGTLIIIAPESATVFINGEEHGGGQIRLEGADRFGTYNVRVHREAHHPWTRIRLAPRRARSRGSPKAETAMSGGGHKPRESEARRFWYYHRLNPSPHDETTPLGQTVCG